MISIDTNIVLRRLLDDEKAQSIKARRLFESNENILITDIVLTEAIWVLQGKRYNVWREGLAAVILGLLHEPNVIFESKQAIWSALNEYANAKPVTTVSGVKSVDFADALIVYKSSHVALLRGEALNGIYTFDQAAWELPGTRKP